MNESSQPNFVLVLMMFPFFKVAMQSPGRQRAFRQMAVVHFLFSCYIAWASYAKPVPGPPEMIGYFTLIIGLLEGAALIGWRLAQLPKSQALEFLLVSPLRPRRVFLAEAAIGIIRFLFVQMTGLPVYLFAMLNGIFQPTDLVIVLAMPIFWGMFAALVMTMWIYESRSIRRVLEILGLFGVLIYLIVGLLFGEQIRVWLEALPHWLGSFLFDSIMASHNFNPFGVIQYWLTPGGNDGIAWERFSILHGVGFAIFGFAMTRASGRLQTHFQDRHYSVIDNSRPAESDRIGDQPLSWWAVRRVMEYSGRVNLWLAVGVAFLYSAFTILGEHWPPQLGRMVFLIFESWGGPAGMATILCVLATVPAVFQYGLWDSTTQDRCRRLELLLLSDLTNRDYAHAALMAAWARGKGYFLGAGCLWLSLVISGKNNVLEFIAVVVAAGLLWAFAFAIGFRSFTKGAQTSGIASGFTIAMPIIVVILTRMEHHALAAMLPHGWVYSPLRNGLSLSWLIGVVIGFCVTVFMLKHSLTHCVRDLQSWYDRNHGIKSVE